MRTVFRLGRLLIEGGGGGGGGGGAVCGCVKEEGDAEAVGGERDGVWSEIIE